MFGFVEDQNFFMLIDEKRQPRDAFHPMTFRRFGPNCALRLLNLQQQPIIPILFWTKIWLWSLEKKLVYISIFRRQCAVTNVPLVKKPRKFSYICTRFITGCQVIESSVNDGIIYMITNDWSTNKSGVEVHIGFMKNAKFTSSRI